MMPITLNINGKAQTFQLPEEMPLITLLRNEHNCMSVKLGCAQEECGACKILINGHPRFSCTLTIAALADEFGSAIPMITTLENAANDPLLQQLQTAFIEHNALQCGYCISGILNSALSLLSQPQAPNRNKIKAGLKDHLCRCGAHNRIIKAIESVARTLPDC